MNVNHIRTTKSDAINPNIFRVAITYWQSNDAICDLLANTFEELGCQVTKLMFDAKLPEGLDIVFVFGPNGSLVPLANQLLACPPSRRPALVFYHAEQFPNPTWPAWLSHRIGLGRSRLERFAFRECDQGTWQVDPRLRWLTAKAVRFRYYGDLHWLRQNDILSILAVESPISADLLRGHGIDAMSTDGFGFPLSPSWGADLGLERDIPVLWLGKIGSKRRGRLLRRIRTELKAHGIDMMVIDGVENPYVFDEERTVLLNRSKIALNLLRADWDNNAGRFYLAALNRALLISEPTLPHVPNIVSGVHRIEAPIDQLADTIAYYLSHDDERRKITEQAYQLVTTELTIHGTISKILDAVVA